MLHFKKTDSLPESIEGFLADDSECRSKKGNVREYFNCFKKRSLKGNLNVRNKVSLQSHLLGEQGGCCCYCGIRIGKQPASVSIEHFTSLTVNSALVLDHGNLLASCTSRSRCNLGRNDKEQRKKVQLKNVLNPKMGGASDFYQKMKIKYILPGEKVKDVGKVSSGNTEIDKELNNILSLNNYGLVEWRREALNIFISSYEKLLVCLHDKFFLDKISIDELILGEISTLFEKNDFLAIKMHWLGVELSKSDYLDPTKLNL